MIDRATSRSMMVLGLGALGATLAWLLIYAISTRWSWSLPLAVAGIALSLAAFSLSISSFIAQTRGKRNAGLVVVALISLVASFSAGFYFVGVTYFWVWCGPSGACL